MSGIVHFKFKSSNAYDSVSFDGAFVSVGELKVLIAEKTGLSKDATSELLLSDPRTQVDYSDDTAMVPKSSSVLVRRVPNLHPAPLQQAAAAARPAQLGGPVPAQQAVPSTATAAGEDDFGGDLYSEQRDEDAALTQHLAQTGQQWEKEVKAGLGRGRGRGRDFSGRGFGRGRGREPPPAVLPKGYICYRCGQQGHHISQCPTILDPDFKRIRPAVGVPTVLLQKKEGGGLLLPDGTTGSLQPNEDVFLREMGGAPGAKPAGSPEEQATAAQAPASSQPAADPGSSEPQPSGSSAALQASSEPKTAADSNALVVFSEAEPALAGTGELGFPFGNAGDLLLPPDAGMSPWEFGMGGLAPPMPHFPLPGAGPDLFQNAPLSREEFQRIQEELRRKQERSHQRHGSRSRSQSRHDRRGRRRGSRSPTRRRESPRHSHRSRRHRSRERTNSRDRRPVVILRSQRSPSPGVVQLRKRSRSPRPRRHPRSPGPPVVILRKRDSSSPPKRPRRRETTRWQPEDAPVASPPSQKLASSKGVEDDFAGGMQFEDSFGTSWEHPAAVQKAAASGSAKAATPAAAADFSVPQLMDEPAASLFQAEPASQGLRNLPRTMRTGSLGGGQSRLQRGVGSRWKAEETGAKPSTAEAKPASAEDRPVGLSLPGSVPAQDAVDASREVMHKMNGGDSMILGAAAESLQEDDPEHIPLPASISRNAEEPRSEKKEKKRKRSKEKKEHKRRRSKPSPRSVPDPAEASEIMQPAGLDAVATYLSSAAEEEHPPEPRPQQLPASVDNSGGEQSQGLGQQFEVLSAVEGEVKKHRWRDHAMHSAAFSARPGGQAFQATVPAESSLPAEREGMRVLRQGEEEWQQQAWEEGAGAENIASEQGRGHREHRSKEHKHKHSKKRHKGQS